MEQQSGSTLLDPSVKDMDAMPDTITGAPLPALVSASCVGNLFFERSKYIPLRLTIEERKFLRLLEAALNVSEYTDKIDVIVYASKTKRIVAQIRELCAILSGLVMAADYKTGQDLFQDRNFEDNAEFLSKVYVLQTKKNLLIDLNWEEGTKS